MVVFAKTHRVFRDVRRNRREKTPGSIERNKSGEVSCKGCYVHRLGGCRLCRFSPGIVVGTAVGGDADIVVRPVAVAVVHRSDDWNSLRLEAGVTGDGHRSPGSRRMSTAEGSMGSVTDFGSEQDRRVSVVYFTSWKFSATSSECEQRVHE